MVDATHGVDGSMTHVVGLSSGVKCDHLSSGKVVACVHIQICVLWKKRVSVVTKGALISWFKPLT